MEQMEWESHQFWILYVLFCMEKFRIKKCFVTKFEIRVKLLISLQVVGLCKIKLFVDHKATVYTVQRTISSTTANNNLVKLIIHVSYFNP